MLVEMVEVEKQRGKGIIDPPEPNDTRPASRAGLDHLLVTNLLVPAIEEHDGGAQPSTNNALLRGWRIRAAVSSAASLLMAASLLRSSNDDDNQQTKEFGRRGAAMTVIVRDVKEQALFGL